MIKIEPHKEIKSTFCVVTVNDTAFSFNLEFLFNNVNAKIRKEFIKQVILEQYNIESDITDEHLEELKKIYLEK